MEKSWKNSFGEILKLLNKCLGENDEWDQGYLTTGLQPSTTNTSKTWEQVKVFKRSIMWCTSQQFALVIQISHRWSKAKSYNAWETQSLLDGRMGNKHRKVAKYEDNILPNIRRRKKAW